MRRAAFVGVLILLGVAGGVGVLAFALGNGDAEPPNARTRSAGATFCPKVSLAPDTGMTFHDHKLRNLGRGLMGESRLYRGKEGSLGIHVGYEALEAYEDLDFVPRGRTVLQGREFELSQAAAFSGQFWAAVFDLGLGPDGCREITVIGRGPGMQEERFRELLGALVLPSS